MSGNIKNVTITGDKTSFYLGGDVITRDKNVIKGGIMYWRHFDMRH